MTTSALRWTNRPLPGLFAVLFAETATGIVLDRTGARAVGDAERYLVFTNADEAMRVAAAAIGARPDIECVVLCPDGSQHAVFRRAER